MTETFDTDLADGRVLRARFTGRHPFTLGIEGRDLLRVLESPDEGPEGFQDSVTPLHRVNPFS